MDTPKNLNTLNILKLDLGV